MAPSGGQCPTAEATSYLVHHIALPPKLPQADDYDAKHERCLLSTTLEALRSLKSSVTSQHEAVVTYAIETIENLMNSQDDFGNVSEVQLQKLLNQLVDSNHMSTIPLQVKAQNAGILISRKDSHVTFEFFELAPDNKNAMLSGRLVRTFPGFAATISVSKLQEAGLIGMLANTISKMSTQAAPGFQPQARKAGQGHDEERDTTHPGMVTDHLLNVIAALGTTTDAVQITKHTREEVLWDNAYKPWRRSTMWLMVRVTLQLLFTRQGLDSSVGDGLYKTFTANMLACILVYSRNHWATFGSDHMHILNAKIVRRLRKLEALSQLQCLEPSWIHDIRALVVDSFTFMNEKWEAQTNSTHANLQIESFRSLQPESSLDMNLPELDTFLNSVHTRQMTTDGTDFKPTHPYPVFSKHQLPENFTATGDYRVFHLASLESWVENHLQQWIEMQRNDPGTSSKLKALIESYHSLASAAYADVPVSMSIMYLTILELWVACDKSACSDIPLLSTYDPEVRLVEFQCLVLPLQSQMRRLQTVELYVQSREQAATNKVSLYRDFGHSQSFAVKYFDQTTCLQDLLSQIERDAAKKRSQKCEELVRIKAKYTDLMGRYDAGECEFITVITNAYHGYTETKHKNSCSRCSLKKQANALDIQIYEWPLSPRQSVAKSTVFELAIPISFSAWRDVSTYVISNVLGFKRSSATRPENSYTLDKHRDLSHVLDARYGSRRIIPLSSVKPHSGTHRKNKNAVCHLEDKDVCLQNALQYRYYDATQNMWNSPQIPTGDVHKKCMYRMPGRSKALERYLSKPPSAPNGLMPNEVVACQSDCPHHFSIEEYKAFGTLPLGCHIFYSNILTQLAAPTLDFAKVETQCLISQTVTQVGLPSAHVERANHRILTDPTFGFTMLAQLETALQRVEENWESWRAVSTLVQLACRILNLASSADIRQRSLRFLYEARRVSVTWLRRLKARAASSTNDEQRTDLFSRATEIALLGVSTFDVDQSFIMSVLQQQDAISTLLQCSVVVQENQVLVSSSGHLQDSALQAWRSLMYRILPKLHDSILRDCTGLNQAVLACWSAFQPVTDATWSTLDSPYNQWLSIASGKLPVHFNLLTAELLVNGLPLSRLPSEYLEHPMYKPLFSASALEVVPTNEPGMRFSAKATYHDHTLHFGMTGADMLVVAFCNDTKLDLIPERVFTKRLPYAFVSEHIHWYDHETKEVIFRPREQPWKTSSVDQWHLRRHGHSWHLIKGQQILVNMLSKNAQMISSLFKSVEDGPNVHIIHDKHVGSTVIELPRLKLDFHAASGDNQIQSRQYRGMVLDDDQRLGTLIGLASKLVLRHPRAANDRVVLIPEGVVQFTRNSNHHSSVSVRKQKETSIHAYQLDTTLGRVVDNGSLQSKLILCYLHALTSHCLPDPLTRKTGTEAALTILASSAVRSFNELTLGNVKLLNMIAVLSPSRSFYPANERVMQRIGWNTNLSPLSQHSEFQVLVEEIFAHEKKMSLFRSSDVFAELDRNDTAWRTSVNSELHLRAKIRLSTFQVAGFGAELFGTDVDTAYNARDRQPNSERGRRAFVAASMMAREQASLDQPVPKFMVFQNHLDRAEITGSTSDDSRPVLRYDSKWLESPSSLMRNLWCILHRSLATASTTYNKFDVTMWLSTMAYASAADMDIIRALVAFYRVPELASIQIPTKPRYQLSRGSTFRAYDVRNVAEGKARSYQGSSEAKLPKQGTETNKQHLSRIEGLFRGHKNTAVQNFVANLQTQWPREHPDTPSSEHMNKYLDTTSAMGTVRILFQHWYDNRRFEAYMETISRIIERLPATKVTVPQFRALPPIRKSSSEDSDRYCTSQAIFASTPPKLSSKWSEAKDLDTFCAPHEPELPVSPRTLLSSGSKVRTRLEEFCQTLESYARSACERKYVDSLRASCSSLHKMVGAQQVEDRLVNDHARDLLVAHLASCEDYFGKLNLKLNEVLEIGSTYGDSVASLTGQCPRTSPSFWLSQLNHDRYDLLSKPWQAVMVGYGLAVTNLHRTQRLVALCDKPVELNEELRHVGHTNWSPHEFPETLLLEAESGIMVREVQATIAEQMMQPPNDENTVMQLNMGEGKSSTIVPIVAAALANREKLVRVIVAKPQSKQMLEMLVAKLGGLLNRRIYHMPFSRDIRLNDDDARAIREMYQECMSYRGVLLVQPEHILSFKLMGIECLLTDKPKTGMSLLDTARWFDDVSRDIVDESDENFSVKFELIYTMGSQRSVGFAPERWLFIQEVLGLVPILAAQVKDTLPLSIEVEHGNDRRYPRVRILREDGAEALLNLLTEHIICNGLTGLPICNQPPGIQEAVTRYISKTDLTAKEIHAVEGSRFWTPATKEPLFLVRGLIAGGVLRFSLTQKRWRVNYGLDASRVPNTMLAVPYKAKDSPSPRSEFSHPDVVIFLTQLSFYYGGLSDDELFDSFVHLLKSDQATIHYNEWVRTAAPDLPTGVRQLSGVSIKDRVMCVQQIFPYLRYSRAAIDYHLTYLVFPKAMKEFPWKLSASGWDLGAVKTHPITGFSGTNDTLHVLPLAVKHLDLSSQSHTNALVLSYLIQDETAVEQLTARSEGTDAEHLLAVIDSIQPEVRVILDVGALILEMNNTEVSRCWLSKRKDDRTEAVVFFKDEELSVLDVSGRIESFQTSPFAKQLDRCLVYLDEAHTRGTDLKLPRDYRAAVTLGANLTKDRLVQACMRLRKLGKGQSVVFMVPEEIRTKICERMQKQPSTPITVIDVLCWSIGETWLDLSRSMPLWAVQGRRYEEHKHLLNGAETTLSQAQAFLEEEAQSIEDRYKPVTNTANQFAGWDLNNPCIMQLKSRCLEFGAVGISSATLQEEQERELSPEIEEERQIERPPKMAAEKHQLHPDLTHLARTGELPDSSSACEPAFQALRSTSAAKHCDLAQLPKQLLVSKDFMRTVEIPSGSTKADFVSDSYQRPVQWILSVANQTYPDAIERLIVLSPYEANQLQSEIIEHKKVTLHLFAPRFNASFAPLDKLKLFNVGRHFDEGSVPLSLTVQLNLFAGSLYLRSRAEYEAVCDFLGLLRGTLGPDQHVFADGFIDPPSGMWGLKSSPVQFLRALLMKIRKEGEGVEKTHMGKLLGGLRLEEGDFDQEVHQILDGPRERGPVASNLR
ncbi:hypothetical protein EKO04_006190 [Ascochyta lentis]|uniref:ubiquitinyl hydrolase 1 n=1 Tax=Ascochyta lentis TaxID=205686 RepID=A0A8H7J268_9PLEO|nr:hypothetical protein EKO04_006190 [Ascochyta lentis]